MGECPTWYRVVKAAQFLGVPPWELAARPIFWMEAAEAARDAEAHAENIQQDREKRRARPGQDG